MRFATALMCLVSTVYALPTASHDRSLVGPSRPMDISSGTKTYYPDKSVRLNAVRHNTDDIPTTNSGVGGSSDEVMARQLSAVTDVVSTVLDGVEVLAPSHSSRRTEGSNIEGRQLDVLAKITKAVLGALPARRDVREPMLAPA